MSVTINPQLPYRSLALYSYTDPSPSEERDGERKGKILKERELRSRGWGNRRDQPTVGEQMVQKYQTSKRG